MNINLLCENSIGRGAPRGILAEWGFSAFIQARGINILFDSGHSGIYKNNAEKMGLDLQKTDFVVLSHRHWDHVDGLLKHDFNDRKKLIGHPRLFEELPEDHAAFFENDFTIIKSEKPLELAPKVFFLGEIPRKTPFETGQYNGLPIPDDTALAVATSEGTVVVTGCSHSGVCNICECARDVTGKEIAAVVGGFHLLDAEDGALDKTIEYLKNIMVKHLCPMHCVDFPAMARFYKEFRITRYGAGNVIELPD